jgi:hypothetical protein
MQRHKPEDPRYRGSSRFRGCRTDRADPGRPQSDGHGLREASPFFLGEGASCRSHIPHPASPRGYGTRSVSSHRPFVGSIPWKQQRTVLDVLAAISLPWPGTRACASGSTLDNKSSGEFWSSHCMPGSTLSHTGGSSSSTHPGTSPSDETRTLVSPSCNEYTSSYHECTSY